MASELAPPSPRPPSPPTPIEEDLSGAHQWSDDENKLLDPSSKAKGKARQLYDDAADSQDYPPVNDDEAETRRIEENLKRWEVAERMKRKAARESTTPDSAQTPSLLAGVGRRASSLWPGRKSQNPSTLGTHSALQSEEPVDAVPLDDIAATPTPSPTRSEPPEDPFANPQSPFTDDAAVMSPSNDPPPPTPHMDKADPMDADPQRPALLTATSSFRRPPTPKPLGLPPPRAPPPPLPPNSPPPVPVPASDDEPQKTRWWHEWLCGFGEGPDRGGEHQAGRTNPFE
ncbi:hypothetical protein C8J57DRAFT_1446320 [Mycena rebaudengoi]|nr:hypothetical protein C8J57DRAFT_1446320 [Mycena rebaudengoi]